jgi:hypothetical protein
MVVLVLILFLALSLRLVVVLVSSMLARHLRLVEQAVLVVVRQLFPLDKPAQVVREQPIRVTQVVRVK